MFSWILFECISLLVIVILGENKVLLDVKVCEGQFIRNYFPFPVFFILVEDITLLGEGRGLLSAWLTARLCEYEYLLLVIARVNVFEFWGLLGNWKSPEFAF